ncbi:Rossmann-like and DUF2520 domain-containing protein [Legionella shakespearei]|uniref:Rossmann-like domain protein n=1 Tax=Legionella shakespearei DSM 23087 TaxID=1122169 RepID=A0A0W0Z0L4_9GAMM|nr:Rossmann-like and DUF2520 domain-containing protein [Legionella shakespearei]KTD62446.1 Rossmann-like domain protein [Legionella shakespearei DSM 23087]
MNYNIIGSGRLGNNIALAFSTAKLASLQGIYNRSPESAQQLCSKINTGKVISSLSELPPADITWITCNDDSIASVVANLMEHAQIKPGSFIIHCSGVLNSAILAPLKKQGCLVASCHPLKAFKTGYLSADALLQVDCVMEGDAAVCDWLDFALKQLGANVIRIKPEAKVIYHAAAVIASNYLITLASCSEALLEQAGISQQQARSMMCHLMQGNLDNMQQAQDLRDALTGPLMRGDIATLALHLQAIGDPVVNNLYKAAGLATLPITSLSEEQKQDIANLFGQ